MSKNTNIADLINYISVDGSGNVVLSTGQLVATQNYVATAVSNLVASAPSTLDTLNELATALGNDANFATTVATSISTRVPQTRTITINGTTLDLSADRSFTVAAGISGSGTTNYIAKWTGGSALGNSNIQDSGTVITLGVLTNYTYNDNNFAGFNIRNTNTNSFALSGIAIQNSGGTTVAQINYVSTVYANPTVRNTLLINTVYDNKLAFATNSGGGGTRADIYFTVNPAFSLSGSNPNQIQILGTSRNVVINYSGTDNGSNFQVNGTSTFSSSVTSTLSSGIFLNNSSGGTNATQIRVNNTSGDLRMGIESSTGGTIQIGTSAYAAVIGNQANNPLQFTTNGTLRMTITSGGNVGIGTSSPAMKLQIGDGTGTGNQYLRLFSSASDIYLGQTGSNIFGAGNGQILVTDASFTSNFAIGTLNASANLIFGTASSERMRITSGGNVLINTTSTVASKFVVVSAGTTSSTYSGLFADSAGADILAIRSDKAIFAPGIYNFTTGSGANVVVFSDGSLQRSTSSLKYKKNVENYTKGLAEVMQMRPVSYNSKNENETQTYAGLIAEEVHELGLTEFVQYADDGTPDALSYSNMVSLLVKAIQEQQAQIEELKARLN